MASPLSSEDLKVIQVHLSRFGGMDPCPICHTHGWEISGTEVANAFVGNQAVVGGSAAPLVILICTTCYFVRHFAWLPIQKATQ